MTVYLVGSGTYLPGEPIPFDRIDEVLGPLTEAPREIQRWIARTATVMSELLDIDRVHYAIDPATREFTDDNVTMSVEAARRALDMAGMEPGEIDLICYGSAQQQNMPTASAMIQEALGIERCEELSVHANCTSAYKALYLAHRLVASGANRTALVVSSSVSSSELVAEYFNQAVVDRESLFLRWFLCDGAGALVVCREPPRAASVVPELQVEATYIESIGGKRPSLMFNQRPYRCVSPLVEHERGLHHLRQRFRNELSTGLFQEPGGSVFLNGLTRMVRREGIPLDTVRYFQVNMPTKHIISSIMEECEPLGIRRDALYTKLDQLGYCGPPMALICLDHILRNERLRAGERILSFVTEVSKFMQAGYSILCTASAGEDKRPAERGDD
jgi:3-oxoacyl-[acyl-carrier-protein] synthase III